MPPDGALHLSRQPIEATIASRKKKEHVGQWEGKKRRVWAKAEKRKRKEWYYLGTTKQVNGGFQYVNSTAKYLVWTFFVWG